MVIEIILVILGILTLSLGLWNVIIGAYVWGGLFLLGGLWSLSLGILYIRQNKKLKKQAEQKEKSLDNINLEDESANSFQEIEENTQEIPEVNNSDLEIEKAVSFINKVIPTSSIEGKDLEELDENTQLITEIEDIDRDVEILQDIVSNDTDSQNN